MEITKINLNSSIKAIEEFNVLEMKESGGELLIKLANKECYNIFPGQKLLFRRYIYDYDTHSFQISAEVTVLSEDETHIIHTTLPPKDVHMLYCGENDIQYVTGTTTNEKGEEIEYNYHILKTTEDHNLFFQDLNVGDGQEIYVKDYEGNLIASYSGISIPLKRSDDVATSANCLTFLEKEITCGKKYRTVKEYQYDFLPEGISRDKIIIRGFSESIVPKMVYFETKFNPFYWYYIEKDEEGLPKEVDKYSNPVKICKLYEDTLWSTIEDYDKTTLNEKYVNWGNTRTVLGALNAYWNVNIGLSAPVNETILGSEDSFNTKFVEDLEETLVPDFIDMERVKYSPMFQDTSKNDTKRFKWINSDGDIIYTDKYIDSDTPNGEHIFVYTNNSGKNQYAEWDVYNQCLVFENEFYFLTDDIKREDLYSVTSITLNYHFRKRVEIEEKNRHKNTMFTSGNVYSDGWYIDPEKESKMWWNGYNYENDFFDLNNFTDFLEKNAETSDLLGYLNFTDNDVRYRKKKVSESFVRLTFYNSKDPIEQKLLFYSTLFIDATNLCGKYIKQMMFMEDENLMASASNLNVAVLMCSADTVSSRVDTKMVITNEYDRTKSAEGFNLYLFAEDANVMLDENGEKTIYMKVEFNHAGNGKTIPMIMWPKDENGKYTALTVDNFIDSLYIPIKLTYFNGKYVYYIPDAYDNSNGNITLVLFEPKMDYEDNSKIE